MTLWVGTSWKMTKGLDAARTYAAGLAAEVVSRRAGSGRVWPGVQPFVIPPLTALTTVDEALGGERDQVVLGVQNAHWEDDGAWTGEVSVPQVAELGAQLVEIGHSERRAHFGEIDETVRAKTAATVRHGLVPLVCVGETQAERDAGQAVDVTRRQLDAALDGFRDGRSRVVGDDGESGSAPALLVAYEPVWAIGEQGREPRPEELADVLSALRSRGGDDVTALLYGGSVTPANAAGLLALPDVDGLFVGRGAWELDGFLSILDTASTAAQARPGDRPAYVATSP
ncbi:triosephosphate isomerase [Knoellia remsis]|uniref:Triosephosphate isomerase n=1 Tax=Knoellia remsis TaxID=407159 RepID=A0A2T0UI92_9MICO|nr:triose-phosphate isomerase [Knoellia remsis]PRY57557.1 triosephosphate isomerase [Knoellia remsis]